LESVERTAAGNPLSLPPRCEAVVGRYGKVGEKERVLVARLENAKAAADSVSGFLKTRSVATGQAFKSEDGWDAAEASGVFAVVVLDAPDAADATKRLAEALERTKEVPP